MTLQGLAFINQKLSEADIPYSFGEWSGEIVYPYFVGEYTETEPLYEYGETEDTFMLTGTSRVSDAVLDLEKYKAKIRKMFPAEGFTALFTDGSAIAIMYSGSSYIPTGTDDLRRIQINLKIKEWRVE
jgi:hypothetical protein